MPGEATAAGIQTALETAPPAVTLTCKGPAVSIFDGTTARMAVAVCDRTVAGSPPMVSCAFDPKPAPSAATVSPGDKEPAIRLAVLITESRRVAGAGGRAILLAKTVVGVDPASRMFPLPSGTTPASLNGCAFPTNVEKSREDSVGSNPATYPEPAVPEKFPCEGARVGNALEVVLPPVIALPDESIAMLLPALIPSPLSRVALRISERPLSSFITKAG